MGKPKDKPVVEKASENIHVCVRKRPINSKELTEGCKECVVIDHSNNQVVLTHANGEQHAPFAFDAVFDEKATQKGIYKQEVRHLVESVLRGYNATVFAYGQSGSGKTHTMTGVPGTDLAGIMPNAIEHIFQEIAKQQSPNKTFKVSVSHLELYNGKCRDLLTDSNESLNIIPTLSKSFMVKGLKEQTVTSPSETLRLFDESIVRRKTASTDLNDQSSRSHSLFTISVECVDSDNDLGESVHIVSKLNLVDLAGSERQSKTGAAGDTLKEGCNINLSLTALGTVIDALVKGKPHVPYRSTQLTMLLKDSLGGNSKTVMFANIGPADKNISETISTLRFADRAKQIKNKPVRNLDPKDLRIQELLDQIEQLTKKVGLNPKDLADSEGLQARIEELQIELANANDTHESEKLAFEEQSRSYRSRIEELEAKVKELTNELSSSQEEKIRWDQNAKADEESVLEVRRIVSVFIKSAVSESELKKIQQSKKLGDGFIESLDNPNVNLDSNLLMTALSGIRETYSNIKKNALSQEDVDKAISKQNQEWQKKLELNLKSMEELKQQFADDKSKILEKMETASKEAAESRVETQRLQHDMDKLLRKSEKEVRKLQEKIEKMKEEHKTIIDSSDKEKLELQSKQSEELKQSKEDLRQLKKEFEDKLKKTEKELKATRSEADDMRKKLEAQLSERDFDLKQARSQLEDMNQLVKKLASEKSSRKKDDKGRKGYPEEELSASGEGQSRPKRKVHSETPDGETRACGEFQGEDGRLNEGMIDDYGEVDRQVFEQLQKALKVQQMLCSLRQQHHMHMESLLARQKELLLEAAEATEVKTNAAVEEVKQLLLAKEKELEDVKEKTQKDQEKLLKRINKKLQEFAQKEAQREEEKAALEEEKQEILLSNEEINKINEMLEMEIGRLRRQIEDKDAVAVQTARQHQNELDRKNRELESTQKELELARQLEPELERLRDELDTTNHEVHRLELALKEQSTALENTKQSLKWTSSLVDKEKQIVKQKETEMSELKRKIEETKEEYRRQLIENTNSLMAVNKAKIDEITRRHEEIIQEEEQKVQELKDKLKSSKLTIQKEKTKYDELLSEYADFQQQFEDFKVSSLRIYKEKDEIGIEDGREAFKRLMQKQVDNKKANENAFMSNSYMSRR